MSNLAHVSERSEPQEGVFQIGYIYVPYTIRQPKDNVFDVEIGTRNENGMTFATIEIILRQSGDIEVLGKSKDGTYHTFELGSVITGEAK